MVQLGPRCNGVAGSLPPLSLSTAWTLARGPPRPAPPCPTPGTWVGWGPQGWPRARMRHHGHSRGMVTATLCNVRSHGHLHGMSWTAWLGAKAAGSVSVQAGSLPFVPTYTRWERGRGMGSAGAAGGGTEVWEPVACLGTRRLAWPLPPCARMTRTLAGLLPESCWMGKTSLLESLALIVVPCPLPLANYLAYY